MSQPPQKRQKMLADMKQKLWIQSYWLAHLGAGVRIVICSLLDPSMQHLDGVKTQTHHHLPALGRPWLARQ